MAETLCGSPFVQIYAEPMLNYLTRFFVRLYMAPEILRYEKYDAKADLWSVGAVLFEMSVGKPPFRAQNHVDLLRKIEKGEDKIRFPDERKPEEGSDKIPTQVADDLKALIRRLLKRNPQERMNFDDFFVEAEAVATGGSAAHLATVQRVPMTAKANNIIPRSSPTNNTAATAASTGPTSQRVNSAGSPLRDSRSAALANGVGAYAQPVVPSPSPPIALSAAPSPPRIPSYIDTDPPPFARRPSSVPVASAQSTRPPSGTAPGTVAEADFKALDYGQIRRKSLGGGLVSFFPRPGLPRRSQIRLPHSFQVYWSPVCIFHASLCCGPVCFVSKGYRIYVRFK